MLSVHTLQTHGAGPRTLGVGAGLAVHARLVHGHAAHGAAGRVGAEPLGGAEHLVLSNRAAAIPASNNIASPILPLHTTGDARRGWGVSGENSRAEQCPARRTGSGAATRASFFSHFEHTILCACAQRFGEGHSEPSDTLAALRINGRLPETYGWCDMSKREIAAFFKRGPAALPAHTRGGEEACPSSEAPAAQTPVLEEVTNRTAAPAVTMDADLREPAGGDDPRGGDDVLPATAAVPAPEPAHVRVFSRKRPAAAAVAAPPHRCVPLPALWRVRSALALCLTLPTLVKAAVGCAGQVHTRKRRRHRRHSQRAARCGLHPSWAGQAEAAALGRRPGALTLPPPARNTDSQVMLSVPA